MTRTTEWSGPLPPPAILDHFEEVVPGSAARIIDEWQAETAHRRSMENAGLAAHIAERRLSRILAFAFASVCVAGALFCAYIGEPWVAGTIATTTIGLVVTALVLNQRHGANGE